MKTAIVHLSIHHHNTRAVAQAMGESIGARVMTVDEAKSEEFSNCDLVGLGSGIFFSSHHRALRTIVRERMIKILGEACYPGWDTVGPLRWIGGIQRGHPNSHDLEQARQFAVNMVAITAPRGQAASWPR